MSFTITKSNAGFSRFNRCTLAAAVSIALGGTIPAAHADTYTFDWNGWFTMLDSGGAALGNSSITTKGANTAQTPVSGTLTYDSATGTGAATIGAFDFFAGSAPAVAQSVTFTDIDGNGPGTTLLANMLFDWNGTNGIPVSLVWDGKGLLDKIAANRFDQTPLALSDIVTAVGAAPASDGTYINATFGYLALGPTPVASTEFDTTPLCIDNSGQTNGDCMTVNPSGALPLITDTAANGNEFTQGDGVGIGGAPMIDGPFGGFNANFDLSTLTLTGFTDESAPDTFTLNGSNPTNVPLNGTYTELGATCSDAIAGNLSGSVGISGSVNTAVEGTNTLTYTCTDGTNAATPITRTVNVVGVAPVIALTGSSPVSHEAASGPFTDAGATCNDQVDGSIPLPTSGPGSLAFGVTSNTVNANVPGAYTVTYGCTDSDGNSAAPVIRAVNVVDTTDPTITLTPSCAGGITVEEGAADPTPSASASDTVDGTLTGAITTSGSVDTTPAFGASALSQNFSLGWSVNDAAGNTGTASCTVTVGRRNPLVTLNGAATVTLTLGDSFTDPGATCADFADGAGLTASPDSIVDTNAAGTQIITYRCADSDSNPGTATRTVIVQGSGGFTAAPTTSGSNFSMQDPKGNWVGGTTDIFANWDGTTLTSTADHTINMTMGSAGPTTFFGSAWVAHDIRVFGAGTYTLTSSRGNTLNFTVAPNQLGAHILFDWNGNNDIDVAVVWDINGIYTGLNSPVNGQLFNLVSVDGDGDGIPGIDMPDGPFAGFSPNFSINLSPSYALPVVETALLTADQGGSTTRTVVTGSGNVTVGASTGTSFNWSSSDAALVSRAVGGTTSSTFTFDPSTLTPGLYTIAVTIDGGPATGTLLINVVNSATGDVADNDNDGIPNDLDADPTGSTPTALQASEGGVVLVSDTGKLELGTTAFASGAAGAGVSMTEIVSAGGIADSGSDPSCIGGCFDFVVTGITAGGTVQIVLPLSANIPADAVYRKLVGGTWRDFSVANGSAIASAVSVGGVCPAPGAADYAAGLNAGDNCVRLTLVDGGANDADGLANGVLRDPGGVAIAAIVETPTSTIGDPSTGGGGGCSLTTTANASQRLDLWLLATVLAWFGLRRKSQQQ